MLYRIVYLVKLFSFFFQDNLHQPQYVEKLEKVIRFLIKEKVLCMEDLDDIWAAQIGQHEAIVKNVHDLLAKLAWYVFVFKSFWNSCKHYNSY